MLFRHVITYRSVFERRTKERKKLGVERGNKKEHPVEQLHTSFYTKRWNEKSGKGKRGKKSTNPGHTRLYMDLFRVFHSLRFLSETVFFIPIATSVSNTFHLSSTDSSNALRIVHFLSVPSSLSLSLSLCPNLPARENVNEQSYDCQLNTLHAQVCPPWTYICQSQLLEKEPTGSHRVIFQSTHRPKKRILIAQFPRQIQYAALLIFA